MSNNAVTSHFYREKRGHIRYPCIQPISLYHRGDFIENCLIKNLCQEGMLLQLDDYALTAGSIVIIEFLSLHEKRQVKAPAFIAHAHLNIAGLWLDNENQHLQHYINCCLANIERIY